MSKNYIDCSQNTFFDKIRGTIHLLEFSSDENAILRLIDRIYDSKYIDFSVFLTIKTDEIYDNDAVLTLSKFDSKRESGLVLKRFSINPLDDSNASTFQNELEQSQLPNDPMKYEQNIRFNYQNVRTNGSGDYALCLRLLGEDKKIKNSKLIDATYFKMS